MASQKLTELTAITSAGDDDILYVADTADGGSTYTSKKITRANLFSGIATESYVTTQVNNLIDSAPGALDTLNELAAAINDDASFSTTVTNLINANETHIDNMATLTGVAKDSTNLGTFTGTTIANSETVKGALQDLETAVESKQATISGGDGIDVTSNTVSVDLATQILANEQIVLSGMSDSIANDTYNLVYRSGSKLKATFDQSGSSVEIDIEREAPYTIDVSGTSLAAANGETLVVQKHTGYLTRSSTTYTWNTGSTGGNFHWYYWNTTSQIFAAYNSTDSEWTVLDLSQGGGNIASFIGDLDSTGSIAGYISGGENFTLADIHKDTLSTSSTAYPGEISRVPSDSGNVSYGTATEHPYYVYQNAAANKWILFARDPSYYWTVLWRSAAFDLGDVSNTLVDDGTAFSLDSTSDYNYITANSDDYGDGVNIPDAADSNVTYSAAQTGSFLEFDSGALVASVKDEDDMSSNSAEHVPTQQSVKAYVDANVVSKADLDVDHLITLTGVADASDDLGTFSGSTIDNNVTIKAALQALETAVEAAEESSVITEIDGNVDDLITLSGVAEQDTDLGTFAGSTIADNVTIKAALQALETAVEAAEESSVVTEIDGNVDDLITLTGIAENTTDLGTFSGSTISDNTDIKDALQSLETAVENAAAGSAVADQVKTVTNSTDATQYLVFVNDDNVTATTEEARTDAGITYNPSSNLLTVGEVSATTLDIGGTNITATAAEINVLSGIPGTLSATELGYVDGVTSSIQTQLDTKAEEGDNVNVFVGTTTAQTVPQDGGADNYLFLVVDKSDGSIKVIDKNFIEAEG